MSDGIPPSSLRVAVYTDYLYRRVGDRVYGERAFTLFLAALGQRLGRLRLVGRLAPDDRELARYPVGSSAELVGLPYYPSLARPLPALAAFARSLRLLWRSLDDVDCAWLLGPHPLALMLSAMAVLRRRRLVLGVRQDLPRYVRSRHRGRRSLLLAAQTLELAYRALARFCAVIVVGPELARHYRRSRRLLEIAVSLVDASQILPPAAVDRREYGGELTVLSVGRVDAEKNPLLLAEVLARLLEGEPRWRLVVCGEGPMLEALGARLRELGIADRATLPGYLPLDGGLLELYRESHVLLHVSWTEGVPQVIFEAFGAALPVVATDVGGIRDALDDAVRLVPRGDARAAAGAVAALAGDPAQRRQLVGAGHRRVSETTRDAVASRVARFLAGQPDRERVERRA